MIKNHIFILNNKMGYLCYHLIPLFILFIIFTLFLFPQNSYSSEQIDSTGHKEEFNAGKMIIEHITDAYSWHIVTIGSHHITLHLPIIIYDKGELIIFSSSEFEHNKEYKGYKIETHGMFKGKIVRVSPLPSASSEFNRETSAEKVSLPLDLSITKNVVALFFTLLILCLIFIITAKYYVKNKVPKGFQVLLDYLILFIRDDIAKPAIGENKADKHLPYLLTLFTFIFLCNLIGLIPFPPGGANVTGSIAITGILALMTFLITSFSANKSYWLHIINPPGVPWWLKFPLPLMPVVELIGVFTKPFVLMVRLFANISAGHIISLGFIGLIFIFGKISPLLGLSVAPVSVAFVIFMYLLEFLVAFLQAYVFTLLSALYIGMATEEHP